MDLETTIGLLGKLSKKQPEALVRLTLEYSNNLEAFLRENGYFYCIQEDAFGVQIIVSDRKSFASTLDRE